MDFKKPYNPNENPITPEDIDAAINHAQTEEETIAVRERVYAVGEPVTITPDQAAEILAVHSQLQTELADQDQIIAGLEGDIELLQAKLDVARKKIKELKDGWEEPVHLCEDI